MTTQTEALKLALEALESSRIFVTSREKIKHPEGTDWYDERITAIKEVLAQPEQERCVGCEACIDTACGRDECPKGWPKAAQPEQEPVAWMSDEIEDCDGDAVHDFSSYQDNHCKNPLYTTTPQRKPLTDEEIGAILEGVNAYGTRLYTFARAIEAKLKEKNTK